ncbi:membrane-associated HD superfamily phosphohydrolase [Halarchaeum solikamskense]|uniref:hypothetical protein n=1 Tax=Halarchaeum nitratireducens TaxID=489913 RepID=UPI001B3AE3FF|nr:hypothetical protein [Halarchaeum solikamskense]MBP2252704.1 membrane-associated HD superfamily phosphohydrolase [Halarchaeum solikamskense]
MDEQIPHTVGRWFGYIATICTLILGAYMFVFGTFVEDGYDFKIAAGYQYLQGNSAATGVFIVSIVSAVIALAVGYSVWTERLPHLWVETFALAVIAALGFGNALFTLVAVVPLLLSVILLTAHRYLDLSDPTSAAI